MGQGQIRKVNRGYLDDGTFIIECRPWALRLNSYHVKENPLRGDVRRLCRALGIELKEVKQ